MPEAVPIQRSLTNPIVPNTLLQASTASATTTSQRTPARNFNALTGAGPGRRYITPWDKPLQDAGYPPRPHPGSVMDLDIIVDKCDFGAGKVSDGRAQRELTLAVCSRLSGTLASWRQLGQRQACSPGPVSVGLQAVLCGRDVHSSRDSSMDSCVCGRPSSLRSLKRSTLPSTTTGGRASLQLSQQSMRPRPPKDLPHVLGRCLH